ncbi:MAG: hypothetical protein ACKVZ0_07650 [Gemmatimonadales bacterium]
MSAPSALPEIGPYLGRLTDVTRRFEDPAVGLDQIRLDLVSELFERGQAARSFLLVDDLQGATASLDRASWLALWRKTALAVADRTFAVITQRFEEARRASRCPQRVARRVAPTAEDREIVAAKFDAAGLPLEELAQRGSVDTAQWLEQVRQCAVALDDSWEELERLVRSELAAAALRFAPIASWQPSMVPIWVAVALVAVVGAWVGAVLGGFLPLPQWLDPLHRWFWSLPWP